MAGGGGFFQWIRDGVRRSVLLGFSDAVEQLGAEGASGELHPELAASLRNASLAGSSTPLIPSRAARKRLGRSLTQVHPPSVATAVTEVGRADA